MGKLTKIEVKSENNAHTEIGRRAFDDDVLHLQPGQIRMHRQDQGHHAGSNRTRRRGTRKWCAISST
jgi:hypothetical protein